MLNERKALAARLGGKLAMEQQITENMKLVRNLGTERRKAIYLSERIDNQRKWYSDKSEANLRSANKFFAGIIVSEVLAIISAFVIVLWPTSQYILPVFLLL